MHAMTFIAGGSKGLGAALVQTFQNNNHQVLEFSRSGTGQAHVDCDFSDIKSSTATFKQTFEPVSQQPLGKINLIINTAVLAPFGSLLQADDYAIQNHININITSTTMLIQAFIQAFQNVPGKKTMTYISSGAARRDIPGLAMYSASKAFFERFIDTTATEQNDCVHPIDCIIINPGVMDTGMQAEIRSQNKDDFPMVDMWHDFHQKGQLVDPKDIATVCQNLIINTGENGGYYVAQDYL
jgi:benzil reductase ((S)-benzoin forming)